jgi:hypothetical protein
MFPAQIQALPSEPSVTFGAWLNLLVACSHHIESEQSFDLTERHMTSLIRRHPRGIGVLLIMLHSEPAPANYSDRALRILRTFRPQLLKISVVLEATGFAAAGQRALAHSIVMVSGMRGYITLHTDLGEAVAGLAQRMLPHEQHSAGVGALVPAAEQFRLRVRRESMAPAVGT